MKVDHRGTHHLLDLESSEVALLDTARSLWRPVTAGCGPQGSAEGSPSRSTQLQGRSMPPGTLQIPSARRRANPSTAL